VNPTVFVMISILSISGSVQYTCTRYFSIGVTAIFLARSAFAPTRHLETAVRELTSRQLSMLPGSTNSRQRFSRLYANGRKPYFVGPESSATPPRHFLTLVYPLNPVLRHPPLAMELSLRHDCRAPDW